MYSLAKRSCLVFRDGIGQLHMAYVLAQVVKCSLHCTQSLKVRLLWVVGDVVGGKRRTQVCRWDLAPVAAVIAKAASSHGASMQQCLDCGCSALTAFSYTDGLGDVGQCGVVTAVAQRHFVVVDETNVLTEFLTRVTSKRPQYQD